MNPEINDGGPAFPGFAYTSGHGCNRKNAEGDWENWEQGLSLRDYFSAKAMSAILSSEKLLETVVRLSENDGRDMGAMVSKVSYEMADAMILERSKK